MKIKASDRDKLLVVVIIAFLSAYYLRIFPNLYSELALAVLSVAGTIPVIISAWKSLIKRQISVDLLASIALAASLIAMEWPSAAFINLMLASARIFGDYTEARARSAISGLLKLRPQKIKIKTGNQINEIPSEEAKEGDLVVVDVGERIAVDGSVIEGSGSVDQSSLTGESVPAGKTIGDKVFSSTLIVSGSLVIKAEKVGEDTTLEKIIRLVEGAQGEKARIRTTADKFATWYIVLTLIGSAAVYFIFRSLPLLLSLLLVACADDIAVAIPMAFLAAIGYAAKRGVIIKGGGFLEGLTKVKKIIVDKTGTLTLGKLKVQDARTFNGYSRDDLLAFAALTESSSKHPVAKAIVEFASGSKKSFERPESLTEVPGRGVSGVYKGKLIVAGNLKLIKEEGTAVSPEELSEIESAENSGYTVTVFSYGQKLAGFISCADEIRPRIKESIQKIKNFGVSDIVMLTGDNEKVARRISGDLGITDFHANLSPEEKLSVLKTYLSDKYKTIMVGDGVNDAAALALSDIGIAMGAIGSDAAIEAADIALMKDDFSEIPEVMNLGFYVTKITTEDFWIWGIVNAIGLILVFAGIIGPQGAAAYNFVTDFFPFMNSLRLFKLHLKTFKK